MAWTDEIVEQLKQHWIDGKSASQIASLLGNGVTRNAVIGKVHRLGLAGRAKTPSSAAARPRRTAAPPPHRVAGPRLSAPAPRMMRGATALAYRSAGAVGDLRTRRNSRASSCRCRSG